MIRVNPLQLEYIKRIYPDVCIASTKHNTYITNVQLENEAAFFRCMSGCLSKRQQEIAKVNKRRQTLPKAHAAASMTMTSSATRTAVDATE